MRARDLKVRLDDNLAERRLANQVARVKAYLRARPVSDEPPVLFFNASTRIHRLSLNAAFALLAAWAVRASGRRALQVVCQQGMSQCPLGTDRRRLRRGPPCTHCTRFSRRLFPDDLVLRLAPSPADDVLADLRRRSFAELAGWEADDLPLGQLVLPTMRWVLRRHDLPDDELVLELYRNYLASALAVARRFEGLRRSLQPSVLVVFNGILYPEAVARAVFRRAGIPVVTHEVGLRPLSAYFSHDEATFRHVSPDSTRPLTAEEEARLDDDLAARFDGQFSMAGIRFWPSIRPLPDWLVERLDRQGPPVVVFTNVVFDTSQVHANTLYPSMFAWLDDLRAAIERHPERLFIVRAHPDETRPGKESQQTVEAWAARRDLLGRPNVVFIPPGEPISTYELIRRAGLVLVYNSSVGLEASILGAPVLCAGRARYSEAGAAPLPPSAEAYRAELERMLDSPPPAADPERARNARRFLHFELYHASLDFSGFLRERIGYPGMVEFVGFDPVELARSPDLAVVVRGILDGAPFVLDSAGRPEASATV